jgi:hypothetical protein
MKQHLWKDEGRCFDSDTNLFFDKYEDNESLRESIDKLCKSCPVQKVCFANGVSGKEWGVWGGIYLENGEISREFSRHRTKEQWGEMWKSLTMENK